MLRGLSSDNLSDLVLTFIPLRLLVLCEDWGSYGLDEARKLPSSVMLVSSVACIISEYLTVKPSLGYIVDFPSLASAGKGGWITSFRDRLCLNVHPVAATRALRGLGKLWQVVLGFAVRIGYGPDAFTVLTMTNKWLTSSPVVSMSPGGASAALGKARTLVDYSRSLYAQEH